MTELVESSLRSPGAELLLRPASIAVLGASDRMGPGQKVVANLASLKFPGETYLINPRRAVVGGRQAFPSLHALPAVPDLVVVAVNREATVEAVEAAATLGVPAAVLLAAGFGEADAHGHELDRRLRAAGSNLALMGPNCLGFVNLEDRVGAYSGPLMEQDGCGGVAVVSQSGAMACTLTGAAAERRIRFSHVITTGNQLGLATADYVRFLARSERARVIACYIEGFEDGRDLLAAFGEAHEAGKLVVVLKSGRSAAGAAAARSHTGALAGLAPIQADAFRRAGVRVADDIEQLLALMELGDRFGRLRRGRVGVVTISGGERLLAADAAEEAAVELAQLAPETETRLRELLPAYAVVANPLDTTGAGIVDGDGSVHAEAAALVAADPNVDIVVACQDAKNGWVEAGATSVLFAGAVEGALRAADLAAKPVVVFSPTTGAVDVAARELLAERGVPLVCGLRTGFTALAALFGGAAPGRPPRPPAPAEETSPTTTVSGYDTIAALEAAGVAVWPTRRATAESEAARHAEALGYPVALKLDGPGLAHRTEVGGVLLGLADEDAVRRAWRLLVERAAKADLSEPAALVQRMAPAGAEVFVGGFQDEQFGPVMLLGPGGTTVELLPATTSLLAPASEEDVREVLDREPLRSLLGGFRGAPPADVAAVAATVAALSRVVAQDGVVSLDVNPLIALPSGTALVDAKLVLALPEAA